MKKILTLLSLLIVIESAEAQKLVSATLLKKYTLTEIVISGIFNAKYEVELYHVIYNTVDVKGNPTIASGALTVPVMADCDTFPLINYNHGTVLLKDNVPSRIAGEEFVGLASSTIGAVGTMPDYLGLGDSPGLHPYQHAESEATATLDMIRASREFVEDSLGFTFNGQVFLTGYSQGGHAAMSTHKYIQDNGLESEFNVVASAPASGAYDMSETTADFVFSAAYSNPGYIVYLVEAYQLAYGNLYTTRDQYYKAPYDQLIVPYLSGDSTMASLNVVLPALIDSLIEDSVLMNYMADSVNFTHPLRIALKDNDVYDWTPNVTVEMSYCNADEQVPFQNSVKTSSVMNANGAKDVKAVSRGSNFNHGQCVLPSLAAIQDLFTGLVEDCQTTTGIASINKKLIKVFPNPAFDQLNIQLPQIDIESNITAQIVGYDGKLYREWKITNQLNNISITDLSSGLYYVRILGDRQIYTESFLIHRGW